VPTRSTSTRIFVLTALFLLAGSLFAQENAATPPPSATAKIFPLSEVHRGLHGVAYTVFEGTQPEAMNVEILGVLKNVLGPGQDMILARLQGSKPEYTGVVAGMSGSPVYIDGKLLGALSYRIGQFSKEPIAGITPIAEMLAVNGKADLPQQNVARAAYGFQPAPAPDAFAEPTLLPARNAVAEAGISSDIHPIETPLVLSGFSPEAVRFFQEHVAASGLMPVAGLGGGSADSAHPALSSAMAAPALLPGSAVSALMVRGDLEVAATCTVTYVDPQQVLACGHPITRYGNVSMPMTKADVVATLASPLNAFKIVNTTETIGAFTEDRSSAIRGVLGESAHMIPVAIHTHGLRDKTLHVEVIDNPDVTPGALMVSLYEALLENNSYAAELSYQLRGTVNIAGYPALHLKSLIAPTEQLPSALRAALTLGQRFQAVYGNSARVRNIEGIDLDIDTLPGRRSIQLERAQAAQPAAHAGDTVEIEATLRPFRGESKHLRIAVPLPVTLNPGSLRILLSDGATLDRLTTTSSGSEAPMELSSVIHQMNSAHEDDQLYVSLLLPNAQAVVDGRTLSSIPISMANVLEPLRTNRGIALNGESVVPVNAIPVDAMLSGMQVVSLQIE
jgi:SpoIVB peptidase S55